MHKKQIMDFNLEELERHIVSYGNKTFHARQIFSWIYKRKISNFDEMSDLPLSLRGLLKKNFQLFSLELIGVLKSLDRTQKAVFRLQDGSFIESVIIPAEQRVTVCISTQVGCKFGCLFCASGILGFKRDLTCAEIIEQLLFWQKNYSAGRVTHVVFMGIGEPLDNYDNLLKAIRIINAPQGINIGARRITISTCGVIPKIKKLAKVGLQVELSVSLHAGDEKTRSALMPVNRIYPMKKLIDACAEYIKQTNRQITFEYVLIKGKNSDLQNAINLSTILKGLNCKVNLIPANLVEKRNIEAPNKLEALLFRDYLIKHGINTTLRKPRGKDIQAACGQLRLRYEKQ